MCLDSLPRRKRSALRAAPKVALKPPLIVVVRDNRAVEEFLPVIGLLPI